MNFLNKMVPQLNQMPSNEIDLFVENAKLTVFKKNTGRAVLMYLMTLILPFTLWFLIFGSYLGMDIQKKLLSMFFLAVFMGCSMTIHEWLKARILSRYIIELLKQKKIPTE